MCGIAGFLLREGTAREQAVTAMCDRIRHRGPDDQGVRVEGPCGIGMRRLSIIDLGTGHQPISNEDGSVWVVFNGEIYNHHELRDRLEGQGHRFRTHSDTETLVHLYEQEGPDGIAHLRGMFAYAIWDARRRELLLARDRFGKKPLYYADTPAGLFFGSELKCLRAAGVPLAIDEEALRLYFLFGYLPDPYSPYRGVRKLMPGCWLRAGADGARATGRYWRMPPFAGRDEGAEADPAAARARLRELFDEAVRIRMEADVPLGAFLSGGIDSSLVVASMASQSAEPVRTFSIGFEESGFNELPYARMVAERYRTEHHEIMVRPDSLDLVTRLVRHFDEPFADSSAIPTYIVSEFAARHVKVALSGDGGDELFGGYESFFEIEKYAWLDRVPRPARALASAAAELLPYSAYGKNYLRMLGRPNALERYFELHAYMSHFLRKQLLRDEWVVGGGAAAVERLLPDSVPPSGDAMQRAMYFEATAQLTGDMLAKVDRASMAASLEVRCPLLDHELAEFATALPYAWKIRGGTGKKILIEALGDRLPPALLHRPKMGFGVPLAKWFRTSLKEFIFDHLRSRRFEARGIARPAFVARLLEEHMSGRRDNYGQLYALLMLELWYRGDEEHAAIPAEQAAPGAHLNPVCGA